MKRLLESMIPVKLVERRSHLTGTNMVKSSLVFLYLFIDGSKQEKAPESM